MPNTNRKYLENKELLKNPKIRAMLDVIGTAEGATYNTRVGGATFDDLSKKPGKSTYIPSIKQNSTAEGRYQFLNSTWGGVAKDLGISDFSAESQDIAAIELIKRRGALNDILTDNFDNAIYKLSPEWASLPTPTGKGYYAGQKAKNINKLRSIFSGAPTEYDNQEVKSQYQETPGFLTVNQGEQQTAGEWTEPKEVSEAKTQLVQAQNEENFIKEFQAIGAQQEEIQQEQPNYLQSQELFTLAPTEQIQYNTPQEFQKGGISQFKKKPFQLKSETTQVQRDATNVSKQQARPLQQLNVRNKTDKEIAQEREQRIQASVEAQKVPYTKENWRQQLANETQATGDKLRVSLEPNFFDDYLNPAAMVGSMASNLGQAPLQAEQSDSILPYVTSVGAPLTVGALAGLGTQTTGQFVNNLVNPLAGTRDLVSNLGNRYLPKQKVNLNHSSVFDEEGINDFMQILKNKKEADKAIELAKSDLTDPETIRRASELGIDPELLRQASNSMTYTAQNSVPSSFNSGDFTININPKQIGRSNKQEMLAEIMGDLSPNFTANEVASHEVGHVFQNTPLWKKGYEKTVPSDIKKMLSIDTEGAKKLRDYWGGYSTRDSAPTEVDELLGNIDFKMNINKGSYAEKNRGYFENANNNYGTSVDNKIERLPMFREYRQGMRDSGVLKNKWDEITPEMVDKYFKIKPENRLNTFMELNDKNKNLIRQVSKIAPSIAGTSYLATQGQSEFQIGGTVKEDREWLQNWYQNRVIPNEEIQNGYFLPQQQDYVNRAKNLKDPKIVDQVTSPDGMPVEGVTRANGDIEISKNAAPHVQLHEMTHSINKYPFLMGDIHKNIVGQNIAPKEAINNEDVKKYYNYYSDPEEVHARIQVLRKSARIKPDQVVTPEFLQNYLKTYQGNNSNINDLLNVADEPHLIEMLNYMADNSKNSRNNKMYAQQGGIINDNRGQWKYPGEITQINSPSITMKNVPYPVLGISDTGEQIMMQPNGEYYFEGAKTVTEYPQITDKEKANLKAKSKHKNKRFSK
jgi:muramidase (phage lysozyme)